MKRVRIIRYRRDPVYGLMAPIKYDPRGWTIVHRHIRIPGTLFAIEIYS